MNEILRSHCSRKDPHTSFTTYALYAATSVLVTLWCSIASAGDNRNDGSSPSIHALHIEHNEIKVDGYLTEDAWKRAEVSTGFVQRQPSDGTPSTERTEVRVLYTSDAIYVGVRAYDGDPEGIEAQLARRDQSSQSDEIALYFDSYYDHRTAFEFAVNPRGAIRDVYYFNDSQDKSDASWDPVWEVQTSIDDSGWTAEFRIPLTQLRFDGEKTSWGFQVYRRIQRKAEDAYWAPYSKESSGFVSLFGSIEGLEGLSQPKRFELRPYSVLNSRYRPESSGTFYNPRHQMDFNGGLDLQYGLTSDFTLNLAVNPDFGQVEADPAVVNLSAFETFYPEKRPFFVEGSGLFSVFLPVGDMFYSRRIGRTPQGFAPPPSGGTVEIPDVTTILTAAKVTGKTARGLGLGIMSALTSGESATLRDAGGKRLGSEVVEPLTHYFTGRVEQDFQKGSTTIGGTVTAVNRRLTDNVDFLRSAAYVGELDGSHRWSNNTYAFRWKFAGSYLRGSTDAITRVQRSSLHYFQRPDADHLNVDTLLTSLSGYVGRLEFSKEAGTWQFTAAAERGTPGFDISDLGFQQAATDFHFVELHGQYLQVKPKKIFRDFRLRADFYYQWTTAGEITSNTFRPFFFRGSFKNNWTLWATPIAFGSFAGSWPGALRGGPSLRNDAWRNTWFEVETDRRKSLSLDLYGEWGGAVQTRSLWYGFYSSLLFRVGTQVNMTFTLENWWNRDPKQWVTRATAFDTTRYIVAEIDRRTLAFTTRVNWIISPTLSLEFYGQPFVSTGAYSQFKEVVAPQAREFNDRFRFLDNVITSRPDGSYDVDLNGDGAGDFSFGKPDFSFRQHRSTLVLRWEYRPGSVLFLAWQHGRQAFLPNGVFGGFRDMADLFSEPSDNTFLVKLNYWYSF